GCTPNAGNDSSDEDLDNIYGSPSLSNRPIPDASNTFFLEDVDKDLKFVEALYAKIHILFCNENDLMRHADVIGQNFQAAKQIAEKYALTTLTQIGLTEALGQISNHIAA